jgi:catechol 2,3-dioxygenase-like lactoylglutathione lyase family enzyme
MPADPGRDLLRMTSRPAVDDLIAYAHVADLPRTIAFYAHLGFAAQNSHEFEGMLVWAQLVSGDARLMIAQADEAIEPARQAILFYLFTPDLPALRAHLLEMGVSAGEIEHPDYMPGGEMRVADPDGYVLLIAQR